MACFAQTSWGDKSSESITQRQWWITEHLDYCLGCWPSVRSCLQCLRTCCMNLISDIISFQCVCYPLVSVHVTSGVCVWENSRAIGKRLMDWTHLLVSSWLSTLTSCSLQENVQRNQHFLVCLAEVCSKTIICICTCWIWQNYLYSDADVNC